MKTYKILVHVAMLDLHKHSVLTAIIIISLIPHGYACIIFIRIEALASISYKRFLTQCLNESCVYSNPCVYFLLFTYPG